MDCLDIFNVSFDLSTPAKTRSHTQSLGKTFRLALHQPIGIQVGLVNKLVSNHFRRYPEIDVGVETFERVLQERIDIK
jgi:hypothetical protein